jgi:hypothetical protein
MKYTTLPNTEIEVSKICLGTMTFGQQNTEAEGHEQMDYALEKELILGHRDVFCSCTWGNLRGYWKN